MVNPCFCGSFHHHQEDDDDKDTNWSPCSTPKRSKRSGSYNKSKESKNPYANRGLDKFNALLAELEDKKQKIYTEKGGEDITVVQFVYSNDNTIKPIVVKVKERKLSDHSADNVNKKLEAMEKQTTEASNAGNGVQRSSPEIEQRVKKKKKKKKKDSIWDHFKLENFRKPSYYLPMMVIVILLLLTVFGRSFAILCTSIGWYVIPTINGASSISRRPKRKKEYTRRVVHDGSSSPRSVITGPVDHAH